MASNPTNNRESLSLFSQLKPYLISPLTLLIKPPIILCHLCLSDKEILTPLTPPSLRPAALPGIVLVCGHMTCQPCFKAWHDSIRNPLTNSSPDTYAPTHPSPPPTVTCPLCRHPLAFLDSAYCRHALHTAPLNPPSGVPLTLPEGGEIPTWCSDCRLLRGRMMGELVLGLRRWSQGRSRSRSRSRGGATTSPGWLEEQVRQQEAVTRFLEEEIALVFPDVAARRDPVGFIMGEIRREMEREEDEEEAEGGGLTTWAGPSGEAAGRVFWERRGPYM